MPIKGLSTREDTSPRFLSLGKLVKGGPKTKDGKIGPDLDHFRFKPKNGDSHELEHAFFGSYGSECNHIKFYLPYDEMERCFSSWREDYGQNEMLKRRCDGEHWIDWVEGPVRKHGCKICTLPMKDSENRCPDCPLSYVGRLELILPPLWEAGFIGLVTLETHSINDIGAIAGKLVQCEPLSGKEFILWREDRKMGAPIKGKRVAIEKSLIFIELTQEWLQMQYLESAQRQAVARLGGQPLASLPEPQEPIDGDEPEEYEDFLGELLDDDAPLQGTVEEPEPAPFLWTVDEARRLFTWTRREKTLPDAEVLKALGITAGMGEYTGTYEDAVEAITGYIAQLSGSAQIPFPEDGDGG